MVLQPLEFTECYLDSPWFRRSIQDYEEELERTNTQIKQLIKDGKNMLSASRTQAKMMTMFNTRLQNFKFVCIGENLTDDEKGIAGSLKEFGLMLQEVVGEWNRTIERAELQLIKPLEAFRKDHIHSYRESKKSFEKASERYYKQLEHTLGLSHKKKEHQLQDSDNELMQFKRNFHKQALKYVYKLQEVQERKKFEFVEHLLMFMQVYFNYFHQSHETASDCKEYMKDLQMRLVATREQYDETTEKTQTLMNRMEMQTAADHDKEVQATVGRNWSRAGYLFLMEKNPLSARLTSKWTKYFCMYTEVNKLFQMISCYHSSSSNVVSTMGAVGARVGSLHNSSSASINCLDPLIVKTCTRRITDSIDKRFCFDLELEDSNGKIQNVTFQAMSAVDRGNWMSVMDGREPDYIQTKNYKPAEDHQYELNDAGFECVRQLIAEIERRGAEHEGIYRLVGVMSKVDLLLRKATNPATAASVDYSNKDDWEFNTLTSALKCFFRKLPEPVMTFDMHRDFINAAKCETHEDRVTNVAALMEKLPEKNQIVLSLLADHLAKVQSYQEKNKMTVQNIGVCFGPTLMKDREETVQSIMELKFCNIIVEILIEEKEILFESGAFLPSALATANSGSVSPKTTVKPNHVTRLPSQRLKQRPRGIYEVTSMPNILEGSNQKGEQKKSPGFSRSKVLRQTTEKSPSTATKKESKERRFSMSSSDEDDDGYGHISPLDLNLDFSEITTPSDSSPAISETPSSVLNKMLKENWSLNGELDNLNVAKQDSKSKNPVAVQKSTREVEKSKISAGDSPSSPRNNHSDYATVKKPSPELPTAPVPKKRLSSRTRRKSTTPEDADTSVQKSKNNNNSNNTEKPVVPKPRSLALSTSMKWPKKNKIFASMKEGLTSPTVPVKYARKKKSSNTELKSKPLRASDSSLPGSSIRKSFHVSKRPKSAIIPKRSLADEMSDDDVLDDRSLSQTNRSQLTAKRDVNALEVEKGSNETSTIQQQQEHDRLQARPRSSPLIDRCEKVEVRSPEISSPGNESEITDDEVISETVRTLYVCRAEDDSELSFQPGEVIKDVSISGEPGWLRGVLNGRAGLVPRNYVEFI